MPVAIRQTTADQGVLAWDPAAGLVRFVRDIVVETTVPPAGRIRQAVRSRLVQHMELIRELAPGCR